MQLPEWISELNTAVTERDLVAVVSAFLKQVRQSRTLPDECLPEEPGNALEIRRAASWLTQLRLGSCVGSGDPGPYQQVLIMFGLAADRIAMLEARGLLVPLRVTPPTAVAGRRPTPRAA